MRRIVSCTASLLLFGLAGCMSYEKPPLAVSESTFTTLKEKDKTVLPENLKLLTLAEAQKIALANNPDFKSVQFTINSAQAKYYQNFSGYAPTLNAGMSIGQSFSKMYHSSSTRTRSQSEYYSPSLSGQWLIFDCLEREMNLLAAKYTLRQTIQEVEDARRLLLRAVAYAFNNIQLAYAEKQIVLAQVDYSEKMLKDSENKYNAGTKLRTDVLNFQISLKNAKLDLISIEYEIKAYKYILAGYLGMLDGTIPDSVAFPSAKMQPKPYLMSVDFYLDQALANRPDLKAYREKFQSAKYSYWATWGAFGPSFTFNYDLNYTQARNLTNSGASRSNEKSGTGGFNYGAEASWNLFNGFSDYFNMKAALASVAETDYALAQTWLDVVTDVRTAYENYCSNIDKAQLALEIVTLTKETRDLVINEYNAGTALVTRLNEAEEDLVEAQNNLATAVVNIENAKAQLDAAVYAGAVQVDGDKEK